VLIAALHALGAPAQARLLERALTRWKSAPRPGPVNLSDYSAMASKHEFADFDRDFSTLTEALERHLAEHEGEYIARK
jgi:hypothetical protein